MTSRWILLVLSTSGRTFWFRRGATTSQILDEIEMNSATISNPLPDNNHSHSTDIITKSHKQHDSHTDNPPRSRSCTLHFKDHFNIHSASKVKPTAVHDRAEGVVFQSLAQSGTFHPSSKSAELTLNEQSKLAPKKFVRDSQGRCRSIDVVKVEVLDSMSDTPSPLSLCRDLVVFEIGCHHI